MPPSQTKQTHEILAEPGAALREPRLTRDDRELYFTQSVTQPDIWLMTFKQ